MAHLILHPRKARAKRSWTTDGPIFKPITVDSKKLEYGPGTKYAGLPSSLGFGAGGQSYSNFLASTVELLGPLGPVSAAWGAYPPLA